jgi:hypothetical protein
MPHYQSFDPRTEINGRTAQSLIINIHHQDMEDILRRHGLLTIDPHSWYSLQTILNVLSDISEAGNSLTNFVSIGVAAAELGFGVLSEEQKAMSPEAFLMSYGQIYHTRLRGGDGGEIRTEKMNDDHFVVTMRIPFPDDVFYGIYYGYLRHFCPPNQTFTIMYDPSHRRREEGGESTVLHVQFQRK